MRPRLPARIADTDANRMSEIRDAEGLVICRVPMRLAEAAVERLNGIEHAEKETLT